MAVAVVDRFERRLVAFVALLNQIGCQGADQFSHGVLFRFAQSLGIEGLIQALQHLVAQVSGSLLQRYDFMLILLMKGWNGGIPLTEAHTPFFDLLKQGIERILSFRQGRLVVFGSNADAAELGLGHDGFPLSETSPGAVGNTLAGLPKPSEAQ